MSLSYQNILLAAGLTIGFAAQGQSSLDDIAGKFVRYVRADRKEKLVVLTDKPFYSAGETIWLKAWCLDSLSNRLLYVSKNLYVDLVNDKDSVISQLLFNIPEQKTAGRIVLPTKLGEGYYWLRAYTARTLQGDSSGIFVKPVYILNPDKPDPRGLREYVSKPAVAEADTSAPAVLFYPEGGSIISGTTATVACRSTSSSGQPVDISGYVTDPLHDTVARFSSAQGVGKFSFDAYNPRKYTAHVRWANRELLYPLPAINQFASQLSVIGRDDKTVKLQVSLGDSLYNKHKSTRILGMSRDSLCFAAIGTDMYQVSVPLANFPAGRACFFLFDDHDKLVSERNIYIGGTDLGEIVAATDKTDYSPGDKVDLRIGVMAQHDNAAMMAILSVAVTDDKLAGDSSIIHDGDDRMTAAGGAQYRGYSPDALDALMLTQPSLYAGWGNTPAAHETKKAAQFADSSLLYVRGRAVNKQNEPLQHYIVVLFSGDKRLFLSDTTKADGGFVFPLTEYNDGTSFNMKLTTMNGKATEGKLILDKLDFPRFPTPRSLKSGLDDKEVATIRRVASILTAEQPQVKDSTSMKPVIVQGRNKLPAADEARRASPFSDVIGPETLHQGGVDAIYNAVSSIPGFSSGMNRTVNNGSATQDPMLVLMDGVETGTGGDMKGFLESLDANNIEFIEVLKGPLTAIYGVQGAGGVILIYSVNTVNAVAQTNDKGLTTIYPKGYYSQPNVYASGWDPKNGAHNSAQAADAPTLYWNGNIVTDNNGKATVDFFTGRQQATYCAAIVGVTPGGDIVGKTIQIKCR